MSKLLGRELGPRWDLCPLEVALFANSTLFSLSCSAHFIFPTLHRCCFMIMTSCQPTSLRSFSSDRSHTLSHASYLRDSAMIEDTVVIPSHQVHDFLSVFMSDFKCPSIPDILRKPGGGGALEGEKEQQKPELILNKKIRVRDLKVSYNLQMFTRFFTEHFLPEIIHCFFL